MGIWDINAPYLLTPGLSVSLSTLLSPYPTVLAVTMTYHQAVHRSHSGCTTVKMAAEMNCGALWKVL